MSDKLEIKINKVYRTYEGHLVQIEPLKFRNFFVGTIISEDTALNGTQNLYLSCGNTCDMNGGHLNENFQLMKEEGVDIPRTRWVNFFYDSTGTGYSDQHKTKDEADKSALSYSKPREACVCVTYNVGEGLNV